MCRRNDVEKRKLPLPGMSVNEISRIGMEIQLCNSMAEGHSLDISTQTQEGNHPCWSSECMTLMESRAACKTKGVRLRSACSLCGFSLAFPPCTH